MKKIGLVVKDSREPLKLAEKIESYIASKNIKVCYNAAGDAVIAMGGDGTILRAVSLIRNKQIPILGINFGTAGFLTEVNPGKWKTAVDRLVSGNYAVEERIKLRVEINRKKIGDALNEAVVITSAPVKMLHLQVSVDRKSAGIIKADGLIVATPTGSTAYSFSCGGPVVDERVNCLIVTPICPFGRGAHSLIIPQDSNVEVKLVKPGKEAVVVIDGEHRKKLGYDDVVSFAASKNKAYFVKLRKDFYRSVRERL